MDRWEFFRDQSIWELLVRLAATDTALSAEAQTTLGNLGKSHPEWIFSGAEREDFLTWMGEAERVESDKIRVDLSQLSLDHLAQLISKPSLSIEELNGWIDLASRDADRFVNVLERIAGDAAVDRRIWLSALDLGVTNQASPTLAERILRILPEVADQVLFDVVPQTVDFLRTCATRIPPDLLGVLFAVWDRLLPRTEIVKVSEYHDRVTEALNHPLGRLADILLSLLQSAHLKVTEGISPELRQRFEQILESPGDAGRLGRVMIASRLAVLHDLEPEWTARHLLPFFDWHDEIEATGTWQGFLWSPFIQPSLWPRLKPAFLSTFDHLSHFKGGFERQLATALASLSIVGENLVLPAEARHSLRCLSHSGRATVAWWLWRRLEDAGNRAPVLWRERIGPWIINAWPREKDCQSRDATAMLANAVTSTRDAFPDAVNATSGIFIPVEWLSGVSERLRKAGYARDYPEQTLALLDSLLDQHTFLRGEDFSGLLGELLQARATLAEDSRFRRLSDLAERARF